MTENPPSFSPMKAFHSQHTNIQVSLEDLSFYYSLSLVQAFILAFALYFAPFQIYQTIHQTLKYTSKTFL